MVVITNITHDILRKQIFMIVDIKARFYEKSGNKCNYSLFLFKIMCNALFLFLVKAV